MTFGYCFKPSVVRLATGWNELESNRLIKKNSREFFGLRLEGNGVSLGDLVFLKVGNSSCTKC